MRFNLGEVWKSVEASGGEPRRAVVVAIEDDGRSGMLFFDTGDEQSFLWAELTQAGKWQVDTSPKPTRSADELKQIILRQIQRQAVCPAGMSVEIRNTTGNDWDAQSVPPPGRHIAYTDCVNYISKLARVLGSLYGVRVTPVGASSGIPTGWMSGDDASAAVVRMTAERRRRSTAALQTGATEPIVPLAAPTVPVSSYGGKSGTSPTRIAAIVEQSLSERPTEIREAAQALSKAIADQIEYLNAAKPNEPENLARQNDFVAFL
jgi:hypothetical protein